MGTKQQPEALRFAATSYTCLQLAEMVLSDCGCSTNNTSLLERVAKRIHVHVVAARKQDDALILQLVEALESVDSAMPFPVARQALKAARAWREGRDFMFNKRAAVPSQTQIDMVLHCPKCGMQHIDKDNYEELHIEAAELGVDREGDRELERWIEEREWTNPPHRSHMCQNRKCNHIWRPADVPTNGVAAIKTTGTQDSPIVNPSDEIQILKAEYSNLKSSYDRLKLAYDAWHEKTGWIHKTIKPAELGQHIADVMTKRLRSQK